MKTITPRDPNAGDLLEAAIDMWDTFRSLGLEPPRVLVLDRPAGLKLEAFLRRRYGADIAFEDSHSVVDGRRVATRYATVAGIKFAWQM